MVLYCVLQVSVQSGLAAEVDNKHENLQKPLCFTDLDAIPLFIDSEKTTCKFAFTIVFYICECDFCATRK